MANYQDFIKTTEYGTPGGLGGVNCRHSYFFVSETQPPAYTDEQLAEMAAKEAETKEYNGKQYTQYEASQKMRQMENNMRKTRLKAAAYKGIEGMGDELRTQKVKYGKQLKNYKDFAETMGLKPQLERVYADGLGRVGTAKGNIPAPTPKRSGTKWTGGGRTAAEIGKAAAKLPKHKIKTFDVDIQGDMENIFKK